LKAVIEEGIDVLKASAREMGDYLGVAPTAPEGWREACRELLGSGKVQTIAVTLGEQGAVLLTQSQGWHAAVPKVKSLTTVGAGDSFLGGLLSKLVENRPLPEALQYAASAGTAALFTHGTGLCERSEVEKLNAGLTVREI
jgi:6-phosphofructokinase 2